MGTYTLIGVSLIFLGYSASENNSGGSANIYSYLFIDLGLLLLWVTQRNFRQPQTDNNEPSRLIAFVDRFTAPKAFAFGAAVTVINFKNLAIFLSAVSVPLLSNLSILEKMITVIVVVLVFCASVLVPILIYFAFPKQANEKLNWLKQRLESHSRPIGIWVPLIFGLLFLFRGITGLI